MATTTGVRRPPAGDAPTGGWEEQAAGAVRLEQAVVQEDGLISLLCIAVNCTVSFGNGNRDT